MALYADWAEHYDADLMDAYGYMAPADAVAAMAAMADQGMIARDARILDAGCAPARPARCWRRQDLRMWMAPICPPKCAMGSAAGGVQAAVRTGYDGAV